MKYVLLLILITTAAAGREQVNWPKFLTALAAVESSSGTDMDNEKESARGWYQMRRLARIDANEVMGTAYTGKDLYNRVIANRMFMAYVMRYKNKWNNLVELIHLWHLGPNWRNNLHKDRGYRKKILKAYLAD